MAFDVSHVAIRSYKQLLISWNCGGCSGNDPKAEWKSESICDGPEDPEGEAGRRTTEASVVVVVVVEDEEGSRRAA